VGSGSKTVHAQAPLPRRCGSRACVCACLCERTNHVALQNSNHIEQHLFEFGEAPMLVVHLVTKLQPYTGDVSSCPAPVDRFRVLDSPRAERQLISRCCCCLLPLSIFWGGVCISFSFSSFEHRIVVDGRHPQLYSERNRATRKSKQLRVRRTAGAGAASQRCNGGHGWSRELLHRRRQCRRTGRTRFRLLARVSPGQ
jgi:hypothetical protein